MSVVPQPLASVLPSLYRVVGQQDVSALRQYLAVIGDDIDHADVNGWTLMHYAAYKGLFPVVQMLHLAGASTEIRDHSGLLPLDYAEFGGHLETTQFLKEKEDTRTVDIFTAAAANAQRALEHLLDQPDTMVNARNAEGKTALHLTAQSGYLHATLLLVAAGADWRARDNDGQTPYDLATDAGQAAVASLLLEAMGSTTVRGVNSKDDKGWTSLNWAVVSNDEARVRELLAKGAKVGEGCQNAIEVCLVMRNFKLFEMLRKVSGIDVGSSRGDTALMGVSRRGNEPLVDTLLQHKANPNVADTKDGNTPLRLAAEKGYVSIVVKLLQHDAHPNTVDKLGNPAVVLASLWGQTEAVQALHTGGANINLAGSGGMTALMWAIYWKEKATAQALLELGADTSIVADNGNTALTWAALRGDAELVQLLLPYYDTSSATGQAELYRALIYAAQRDDNEMAEILLPYSNDPEVGEKVRAALRVSRAREDKMMGDTHVIEAIKQEANEKLVLLLSRGADPDHTDAHGIAPILWAVQTENKDALKILLAWRANPNAVDSRGLTPMMLATEEDYLEMIEPLLEYQADTSLTNSYGEDVLTFAEKNGRRDIAEIIRKATGAEQ